jgi:hypothetical protein
MANENNDERRKFQRVLFDADTQIEQDSVNIPVRLIDISLNGALLQRPKHWSASPGDRVSITITLDQGEQFSINMQARVAHIENDKVGLHCEDIDMDSITFLRRLMELNLGNPKLLERELSALG